MWVRKPGLTAHYSMTDVLHCLCASQEGLGVVLAMLGSLEQQLLGRFDPSNLGHLHDRTCDKEM